MPDSQGWQYGSHEDSRLSIAKIVVTDVLNTTKTLANFGLMTFLQTHYNLTSPSIGYFTYRGCQGEGMPRGRL